MGLCTDETGIQFRLLNASRGPAVRSPRAQVDRHAYNRAMVRRVLSVSGLTVLEGEVRRLLAHPRRGPDSWKVEGIELGNGARLSAQAVVLTTGTFLGGVLHVGGRRVPGGRHEERAASILSRELRGLGLRLSRHKTGTPPRLDRDSIDLSGLEVQAGDESPLPFSFRTRRLEIEQLPCHLTWTTRATHQIIRDNAMLSAMYLGGIRGPGPRYCPSVEDKVMRFPDRPKHQIFLEPEGRDSREIYPNGISTSLPAEVQERFLRTIPGLEEVRMLRPGYAVEYDHLATDQLRADLSVNGVLGLFAAGQINGTSGYEEAAVQGFVAGVNAVKFLRAESPFLPDRSQSYIGVLIDDLCRVNPSEPYRMFTSRAEHRLFLRHGNADLRLAETGHRLGLVPHEELRRVERRRARIDTAVSILDRTMLEGKDLATRIRRPGARLLEVVSRSSELRELRLSAEDIAEVEARVLYAPYLERHARERERLASMAAVELPSDWDFRSMRALKTEAREVLEKRRPLTLGEARNLPGVTPADLSVIMVELRRRAIGKDNDNKRPGVICCRNSRSFDN
ncbi:MAG: tRNA uridine-5-carboxymethylaminomethyl(34) synthesis enzyme MnmG, partial [Planctomycetota bacterium]